jgi:hypothetical protein
VIKCCLLQNSAIPAIIVEAPADWVYEQADMGCSDRSGDRWDGSEQPSDLGAGAFRRKLGAGSDYGPDQRQ